jgi:hypothetical protein
MAFLLFARVSIIADFAITELPLQLYSYSPPINEMSEV